MASMPRGRYYFFGNPTEAPIPGPGIFPICFDCHTPFVLRRTQGFQERYKSIVEWRFFQDCACRPARYKVVDEGKDASHGAQLTGWLTKGEDGRWSLKLPKPPAEEPTTTVPPAAPPKRQRRRRSP